MTLPNEAEPYDEERGQPHVPLRMSLARSSSSARRGSGVSCHTAARMNKTSLSEKFSMIHEHWRPKVVAQVNGQEVKLVKVQGVFPWHHHEHEDEMFLVWRGQMT